ncbi:MAG TPA: UPF0182 family protein [Acidimicrobiales bacterium]|nr:UPF0182 family protein [Acidimicrobiales bacterium]
MRNPQDIPRRPTRTLRPRRIWILLAVVVVIVVVASMRSIATFYTDYLWFSSVHLSSEWRRLLEVKAGLFFGFAAAFFLVLWVNLAVVDRLAPSELALGPDDELVRRYQQRVAPRAVLVRSIVSVVVAAIAAAGTIGQWSNFLLFSNAATFPHLSDPQFHKNVGFFVFALPFLSFIVSWAFVSLVVIAVLTVIAHYLNGGIRVQQGAPTVAPQVKVHISVLLACMALVKVFGYILARYNLDLSQNGYVQGAGYTDVHARLPALTLLMWISVLAMVILVVNIWRRGWALPVLAVGLWAFVAVVVGAIYPAIVQALKVNPAQVSLEHPYIARNIAATREAMNLNGIQTESYAASQSLTPQELAQPDTVTSLSDVRLWDPEWTDPTYEKLQDIRSYYSFQTLALDRYSVNGSLTPMVVGVRQINDSDLPAQGWVNTHLQYTHGYGFMASPANLVSTSGQPVFSIADVPPVSQAGLPQVVQPSVYYGLNTAGTQPTYVIGDTRQQEIDYQLPSGNNVETQYRGSGGVQLSSIGRRLAFALRFNDLNLLISDLITPKSRLLFETDIQAASRKAAPFLSLDSDPYPVLVAGQIYWVQDAYTTTDHYPYAQIEDTTPLSQASGLQKNFNYVRNSVKIVVNAYTGAMTFYDMTNSSYTDPILKTWERAFPGMFTPASAMPSDLRVHLRYPEDIFTMQATAYGRYHITNPSAFYNAGDAWNLSQTPGAGSPSAALAITVTTNAQGQAVSTGQVQRMAPLYEVFEVPGETGQSFNLIDALVPVSRGDQIQTLSGFMVAGSDPGEYGKLRVFITPRGQAFDGPALIDARISATPAVSQEISLLNQNGSSVILGNVLMVPVGQAVLYFRPLYVQSSRNSLPVLQKVIAVYGGAGGSQVAMGDTLAQALDSVLQASVPLNGQAPSSSASAPSALSSQIQSLIAEANTLAQQVQNDLKQGNLGQYQTDVNALEAVIQQLQQAASSGSSKASTTPQKATGTSSSSPTGVALGRR